MYYNGTSVSMLVLILADIRLVGVFSLRHYYPFHIKIKIQIEFPFASILNFVHRISKIALSDRPTDISLGLLVSQTCHSDSIFREKTMFARFYLTFLSE